MKVLMVEARYHEGVSDALADGATAALQKGGAWFERFSVPGVLEIPPAIAWAAHRYDGFLALGCVLQQGTFPFQMIAAEITHGLMRLGIEQHVCIGNGVLACETENEALR